MASPARLRSEFGRLVCRLAPTAGSLRRETPSEAGSLGYGSPASVALLLSVAAFGYKAVVELRGLEPLTSTLPVSRSPN
jgi:hypothetical protein